LSVPSILITFSEDLFTLTLAIDICKDFKNSQHFRMTRTQNTNTQTQDKNECHV
jgi:hypothetical protein